MAHLSVALIIQNVNLLDLCQKLRLQHRAQLAEPKYLGKHDNGNDIFLKNGRFGPYLQYEKLLESIEKENKKKKKKSKKTKKDGGVRHR